MRRPPPELLPAGVVHVWNVDLAAVSALTLSFLTQSEVERATRLRFEQDRARFVRARAVLRALLGWYVDEAPERLEIGYGPYGKPYAPAHRIEFSVSHAASRAVFALAADREVGIDVEKIGPWSSVSDVVKEIVSPHDYLGDDASSPRVLTAADVVALWVKKEAVTKVVGVGLNVSPRNIYVAGASSGLHRAGITSGEYKDAVVCVRAFEATGGFAGAVAARGCDWTMLVDELPASTLGRTGPVRGRV